MPPQFIFGLLTGWLMFTSEGKKICDTVANKATDMFNKVTQENKDENEKTV